MKFKKEFIEDTENIFEMSNLSPRKTGLKKIIWISVKGNAKHGPRIKVYKNNSGKGENFSVTIGDTPSTIGDVFIKSKDLNDIFEFIKINKDVLLKHWNNTIFADEAIDAIISV